jgi:hypothetical protein
METVLQHEVKVPAREVTHVEYLLRVHGINNVSVICNTSTFAILKFGNEADYLVFLLKDILGKMKEESGHQLMEPDFDFMIRLEKKLKTYSKGDEYYIRKALKGK